MAKLSAESKVEKEVTPIEGESVKIYIPRKVTKEDRPNLVGYFSVETIGLPIYGKAMLIQKKGVDEDKEPVIEDYYTKFHQTSYVNKDGETVYVDYIHPLDKETRKAIHEGVYATFMQLADEKFNADTDVYDNDGVQIKWPHMRDIAKWPEFVGEASFNTCRRMRMNNVELLKKEDGTYFIAFPASNYPAGNNEWKKSAFCGPSTGELAAQILEAAVAAFETL